MGKPTEEIKIIRYSGQTVMFLDSKDKQIARMSVGDWYCLQQDAALECIKINPENSLVVAENIGEMYKELKSAIRTFEAYRIKPNDPRMLAKVNLLSKLEGK